MTTNNRLLFILAGICMIACMAIPVNAWQDQVFSPFVDTGLYPDQPLSTISGSTGVRYYTLAFITGSSSGAPMWAGTIPVSDHHYLDEVKKVRAAGGDVIISFGGADGSELATLVTDADTLQARYQSVIDAYDATWIDFDIEGAAVTDTVSVNRRNTVIARLQAANPGLRVSYTLPAEPDGLTANGLSILRNAAGNGVRVNVVNIMTMDFGAYYAPNPDGKMGDYAVEAAESVEKQLQVLYPEKSSSQVYRMIGITPMIGRNDVQAEVFTLADAKKVEAYAKEHGIGLLAMWSLARDNGSGAGAAWASATSSGLVQEDFAFSRIFNAITGSQPVITPTPTVTSTPAPTVTVTATPTPAPTSTPSGDVTAWRADATYVNGDRVTYGADTYTAQWWTKNEIPGKAAVWKRVTTGSSGPVAWDSSAVYTAGDLVTSNGLVYQAQWWTTGDIPGTASVWKRVTSPVVTTTTAPAPTVTVTATPTPVPTSTPSGDVTAWRADATYVNGNRVTYGADTYTAQWWTKNEIPGKAAVWKRVTTGSSGPVAWDSSAVYTAGDLVTSNGLVYQAQWWTTGDIPGTASVWKRVTSPVVTTTTAPAPTVTVTATPTPVPTSTPSGDVTAWRADATYVNGNRVTYGADTYTAQWWTKNEIPGKAAVWKRVTTAGSTPVAWDTTAVYTAGDTVISNGLVYQAQWWTTGDIPGTASVWKRVTST
ncbi:carbohydrate-binding protein [uncultured Methanoregula sp.]|uniref:chitinase n=1 Tax=uncultured Methanoregula sp. TaxID=1005933 RepID=UPI002AABAC8B|nr:carbohydrate-binding protein [uncultured Methanoregula sp.]